MTPGSFDFSTFNETPVSPKLADGFIGMVISVEEKILEKEQSELMIHGAYRFKAAFSNQFESLTYEMAVVCVDAATHTPTIKNLQNPGFDLPDFKLKKKLKLKSKYIEVDPDVDETTIGSWFNTRIYFPANSSRPEAGYHIFAIIGDQKSNILRLRRKGK